MIYGWGQGRQSWIWWSWRFAFQTWKITILPQFYFSFEVTEQLLTRIVRQNLNLWAAFVCSEDELQSHNTNSYQIYQAKIHQISWHCLPILSSNESDVCFLMFIIFSGGNEKHPCASANGWPWEFNFLTLPSKMFEQENTPGNLAGQWENGPISRSIFQTFHSQSLTKSNHEYCSLTMYMIYSYLFKL